MNHEWRAHFVVYLKYYNIKHKQRIEHKNRFEVIQNDVTSPQHNYAT